MSVFQHEKHGDDQTGQNSDETENYEICHKLDYRVSLNIRFWLLTLAAALGIGVTASLGVWQISRAAQKEALQTAIEQQSARSVVDAQLLLATSEPLSMVHRRAVLKGTWQPQHTVFLDNRQMDGKPGFFVLTPFELADQTTVAKKVIVVQRGWVARHFLNRTEVPVVNTVAGLITIEGRIAPPPSKLYAFKGADLGLIRQNIDLAEFSKQIQQDVLSISLLQLNVVTPVASDAKVSADGLLRNWQRPNTGVEKHYGYAAQWWALSALIAILYLWFQIVRPKFKLKSAQHD